MVKRDTLIRRTFVAVQRSDAEKKERILVSHARIECKQRRGECEEEKTDAMLPAPQLQPCQEILARVA